MRLLAIAAMVAILGVSLGGTARAAAQRDRIRPAARAAGQTARSHAAARCRRTHARTRRCAIRRRIVRDIGVTGRRVLMGGPRRPSVAPAAAQRLPTLPVPALAPTPAPDPVAPDPPPPPDPPDPPDPPPGFTMGVVAGAALSYELRFLQSLGTTTARLEFGIGASASTLSSTIDAYARAGIRPLLLASFNRRLPTSAEAQNLASWAAAFGPGGSFRAGKGYAPGTAVTTIEFGNETSYSYQFSDNSASTYAARAQTYAQRAGEAADAIAAANSDVGLLAIADNAVNQTAWVTNMFRAVPDLGRRVAGWTIHPYGPTWASRIDSTVTSTRAAGSPDLPIWVTEWGLSTDDGRCLSDNYGWSPCMTYATAASTLHTALAGMRARYGARLRALYLYQAHDLAATGSSSGRESYFGALQSTGAAKGTYTTEVKADLAAGP